MHRHHRRDRSAYRVLCAQPWVALLKLALGLAASVTLGVAHAAVEECQADGKWINLNHGGMTANLTAVVRCTREGKPTREIPYVNGKVHGTQKRFGMSGSADQTVQTEYRDGKRDGVQRTFDPSGRLVSEITFANDRELGLTRHFHPNGKLKREIDVAQPDQGSITHDYDDQGRLENVTCGRQVTSPAGRGTCRYRDHSGVLETYWPDGKLKTRAQFKAGLIDGVFERFERDGTPERREEMRAGYVHGTARALGAEGRVLQEAQYRDGVRHGPAKVFHESGKLLEELTFEEGELVQERTYFLNGETRAETRRVSDRVHARGFWDNGKLRYEATFLIPESQRARSRPSPSTTFNPIRMSRERDARYNEWGAVRANWSDRLPPDGVEKSFHENGNPAVEITYRHGKRDGLARAWHPNGKLAVELTYVAERITARKEFDENGTLIKDEEYLEDGSRRRR